MALSSQLADAALLKQLSDILTTNRVVQEILTLHKNAISDDFITKFDYLTKKELLVFVYYIFEFNNSELLYLALAQQTTSEKATGVCNILDEYEKVIMVYQSHDPYLV